MQLRYPLDKIKITQFFGERPDVYKPLKGHMGIDFRTIYDDSKDGKRPVYAAANGVIVECGDQGDKGYGKFVRLRHNDGSESIYGHLSDHSVQKNQSVFVGKQIGVSGNTGFSSAPHLHFGYRLENFDPNNGYAGYIDPKPLFTKEITTPYFERKSGQSTICYYDPEEKALVAFDDGNEFKALFGSYEGVNIVEKEEWSMPISCKKLIKQ